jgi:hypothetical protein
MMKTFAIFAASATLISAAPVVKTTGRFNEVWTAEQEAAAGVQKDSYTL